MRRKSGDRAACSGAPATSDASTASPATPATLPPQPSLTPSEEVDLRSDHRRLLADNFLCIHIGCRRI